VAGKLLVEKAEEIAAALNVPMWQLFVSPEEVSGSRDFVAFIKDGKNIYHANNIEELEDVITGIKGQERNGNLSSIKI
jgi:hypothetical protein